MSEESGSTTGQAATRNTENGLLQQAATALRLRYERGEVYRGLSPSAAAELENTLTAVSMAEDDIEGADRAEAIALAHRLLDDDNPELSPLWPSGSG